MAKRSNASVSFGIQVEGQKELSRALRVLQEKEAPFLKAALEDGAMLLRDAARRHAKPSIAASIEFVGVRGRAGAIRAIVNTKHPAGRSHEFGRVWYYRGYSGRRMRATGQPFRSERGQKPEPYLGIVKGNGAVADTQDEIKRGIERAFVLEWERIAAGGEE